MLNLHRDDEPEIHVLNTYLYFYGFNVFIMFDFQNTCTGLKHTTMLVQASVSLILEEQEKVVSCLIIVCLHLSTTFILSHQ